MAKKLKIPFLFKTKESKNPWKQWPSCKNPKTLSFRANDEIFKTVNSVFFDPLDGVETPESWFTNSSESASYSTESDHDGGGGGESLEMVVRGVRSERLFFEPGDSNSILEEAKSNGYRFKETLVVAMESNDPFKDFTQSMVEMVELFGLKDWDGLEQLLGWYLRVNGKNNHGFVIEAFVDLVLGFSFLDHHDHDDHHSCSYVSAVSSFSNSSGFPLGKNEICEEEEMVIGS